MSIRRGLAITVAIAALALLSSVQHVASAGTGLSRALCNANQPSTFSTSLTIIDGNPVSYGFRGPSFSPAGHPSETLRTFWGGITAPTYSLYGDNRGQWDILVRHYAV